MAGKTKYWSFTRNQSNLEVVKSVLKYVKNNNGLKSTDIHKNILNFISSDTDESFGDDASPSHKTAFPDRLRLIYEIDKKIYISTYGELFLTYKDDKNKLKRILSEALFKVQFPASRCEILDIYNIYYFRLIFKLLLEKRLDYKLSKQDIVNELFYITNISSNDSNEFICKKYNTSTNLEEELNYDQLINNIVSFRDIEPYKSDLPNMEISVSYVLNLMVSVGIISYIDKDFFRINDDIKDFIISLFDIFPLGEDVKTGNFDYDFYNSVSPFLLSELFKNGTPETQEVTKKVSASNSTFCSTSYANGFNLIVYGCPGTGKSYKVDETFATGNHIRVTFHPEYTNSDFIGYIKPFMNGDKVGYKFEPGPFSKILKSAIDSEKSNDPQVFNFIIDEINRANAPAIFGDLFQLLDRDSNNRSKYSVYNSDVANFIFNDCDKEIYLPANLNIIATMNTSDQNVFTMDTAFKRRWKFKYLPIEFSSEHKFADSFIPKTKITWKNFVSTFNNFILDNNYENIQISEDKQIGPYFIDEDELNNLDSFAYKVLLYIWDDVVKMDKEFIFDSSIKSFSQLVDAFTTNSDPLCIFNGSFLEKLSSNTKNLADLDVEDDLYVENDLETEDNLGVAENE